MTAGAAAVFVFALAFVLAPGDAVPPGMVVLVCLGCVVAAGIGWSSYASSPIAWACTAQRSIDDRARHHTPEMTGARPHTVSSVTARGRRALRNRMRVLGA